jgi:hypothetical protein
MLSAHLDGSVLVVEISGSIAEFAQSLSQLKDTFHAADRSFDDNRKVWLVRNLDSYADVDLVRNARRSAESQLALFSKGDLDWNPRHPPNG